MIGVIKGDLRYNVFKDKEGYILSNNLNDFKDIDYLVLPFLGIDSYYNIKGSNLNLIDILRVNDIRIIFVGKSNDALNDICEYKKIKIIEMLNDLDFVYKNSMYTASGIIDYLQKKGTCVSDMRIFIMGYGNISSSLARILDSYDVDFVIYPNNDIEKKFIVLDRYKVGNVTDLTKYNIVINTIPCNYNDDYGVFVNTKIIDVASSPFGFDVSKLINLDIDYVIYSSIPSKYLVNSASNLVFKFVEKHLKN